MAYLKNIYVTMSACVLADVIIIIIYYKMYYNYNCVCILVVKKFNIGNGR